MSALLAFAQIPLANASDSAKRQRTRCMADAATLRKYCAGRRFKSYEDKLRQVFRLIRAADQMGLTKPELLELVNDRGAASYKIEWVRLACRHLCWAGLVANGHNLVRYLRPLERTERKAVIFHRTKMRRSSRSSPIDQELNKSTVDFAAPPARRFFDPPSNSNIQSDPPTAAQARKAPVSSVRQQVEGSGFEPDFERQPLEPLCSPPLAVRAPRDLAAQPGQEWPPQPPSGGVGPREPSPEEAGLNDLPVADRRWEEAIRRRERSGPPVFTPIAELEKQLGIRPLPEKEESEPPKPRPSKPGVTFVQWGHRPEGELVQGKLLVELADPDFQRAKSFHLEIRVLRSRGLGTEHIAAAKRWMVAKRVPLGTSPSGKLIAVAEAIKRGRERRGEPPLSLYDRADHAARDLAPIFFSKHSVGGMQWLF